MIPAAAWKLLFEALATLLSPSAAVASIQYPRASRPRWHGPYSADQVLDLARRDWRFARPLLLPVAQSLFSTRDLDKRLDRVHQNFPGIKRRAGRDAERYWNPLANLLAARNAQRAIGEWAETIATISNKSQRHPVTVVNWLYVLLGVEEFVGGDIHGQAAATLQLYASENPQRVANIVREAQSAERFGVGAGELRSMQAVLRALRGMANIFPIPLQRGHVQRPQRQSKSTLALEVLSIEYLPVTAIQKDQHGARKNVGRRVVHHTAGSRAASLGRDDNERAGILRETAAGRLWLCSDGTSLYFATDREPTRPVFRLAELSPRDAVLFDAYPASKLVGFVV